MPDAVCLLSGGLDSTVAVAAAKAQGFALHFFHVDYGQKAESRERQTVDRLADALGAQDTLHTQVPLFRGLSALTRREAAIPLGDQVDLDGSETPATWVYCRNLVFVSLAAAYAEYLGAEAIFVGFNAEEGQSYPDNKPEFVNALNTVLEVSIASFSRSARIEAPLLNLRKAEIVRMGQSLGAPMGLTWSCYLEGDVHCGRCESCQHRRRGFVEAGVDDPTQYLE